MSKPITQEEVLYTWGISELSKPDPDYVRVRSFIDKAIHTVDERRQIVEVLWENFIRIKHNKALVLLGDGQALWRREETVLGELGEAVFHPFWVARARQEGRPFSPPALRTFAERFGETGWLDPQEPVGLMRMRGEPILVSAQESGRPWVIMDGCHRLYSLWKEDAGREKTLSVIRGVHPKVGEWFAQW